MGAYAAAAGLVLGGIGTIFSSQDARRTRNQLRDLANTPGLDIDSEIANAYAGYDKSLPTATRLAGQINAADSASMNALLEAGIPGYSALRSKESENIAAELRGEVSPDVMALLDRTIAARGISRGTSGSEFDRNDFLRQLGLTSVAQKQKGGEDLARFIQTTQLPGLTSAGSLLGPTIADRIGIRRNERTQRMNILQGSVLTPGTDAIIGNWLQSTGGALMGAGLDSMGGGSGGGGGGGGGSGFSSTPGPGQPGYVTPLPRRY